MSTATTDGQLKTLMNRLRSYTTPAGDSLNAYHAKVYAWFPSADAALPHVVLSKIAAASDPDFHHLRETFTAEFVVRGRARLDEPKVSGIADVIQSAFQPWADSTSGLMLFLALHRGEVQYTSDLPEQELIEVRVAIDLAAWPVLSTALT